MELATWILVVILSVTLFIFLILGIILLAKLIKISKSAQAVVDKGQNIADKTEDVVENIKGMTSVGGLVKNFVDRYNDGDKSNQRTNNKENKRK